MPVGYAYEAKTIHLALARNHSDNDFRYVVYQALADPAFVPGVSLLIDLRDSSEVRTDQEMRFLAAFIKTLQSRISPYCAVVVSGPVQYGLARMFATFAESEGIDVLVTSDIQEARRWLVGAGVDL